MHLNIHCSYPRHSCFIHPFAHVKTEYPPSFVMVQPMALLMQCLRRATFYEGRCHGHLLVSACHSHVSHLAFCVFCACLRFCVRLLVRMCISLCLPWLWMRVCAHGRACMRACACLHCSSLIVCACVCIWVLLYVWCVCICVGVAVHVAVHAGGSQCG